MRINSYLAKSGIASRRKAESFILEGRVTLNKVRAKLTDKVLPGDLVEVDGKKIEPLSKKYFLVNKPVGFVSTVVDAHAQKKVTDLVPEDGLFPVGRLDKDSEGLMILTNDGDFAQKMMHPSHSHEKEYMVEVLLPLRNRTEKLENAIKFFKCGVKLDGKKTAPSKIVFLGQEGDKGRFNITLNQGMNRQIRRTFDKSGLKVTELKRIRMGKYRLDNLEKGAYKKFVIDEG